MPARGDSQSRAEALLRRRRPVTLEDVTSELADADASELRRWFCAKLRSDDLEEDEIPTLLLIASHVGLGPARRDIERISLDDRRPPIARGAARRMCGG